MFCTKCGQQIEEGAQFCTKCGTPVEFEEDMSGLETMVMDRGEASGYAAPAGAADVTQVMGSYGPQQGTSQGGYTPQYDDVQDPSQSPVVYYVPADAAAQQPQKKSRGALIAVLCVLAALAVGVAVFFGLRYFNDDSGSGANTTQSQATTSANANAGADNSAATSSQNGTQGASSASQGTVTNNQQPSSAQNSQQSSSSASASQSNGSSQNSSLPSSNPYSAYTADYIIPDSSSRMISSSELSGYSADQLRIARNEIYARHGRMFNDSDLQAYFNSKHWYTGTIAPDSFVESQYLSETERKNAETIRAYEESHGYL